MVYTKQTWEEIFKALRNPKKVEKAAQDLGHDKFIEILGLLRLALEMDGSKEGRNDAK